MDIMVFRVLMAAVSLLGIDLVAYGFTFGFAVFVVLSASIFMLFVAYHRLVIQRKKCSQAWHWERFGNRMYQILEVA